MAGKEIKMKKNKVTVKGIIAGVIIGALAASSVPAIATGIDAVLNSVNIAINDNKVASSNENYELQNGTSVPYSILYEGTTYLPVRKISELLDFTIDWDNDTRTILIETNANSDTYDGWYGVPDFGEFYGIKEFSSIPTVRSHTHWYNSNDVKSDKEYISELEKRGYKKVEDGTIKSRFKIYKKNNTEVWFDLGLYTSLVYGVTVVDTTRPITGRHYSYTGNNEDIPDFCSAFGYEEYYENKMQYINGDFHLWSCLPDYITLLEQEGFTLLNVEKGLYGKILNLKKGKSTVKISFNGTKYSAIPSLVISY